MRMSLVVAALATLAPFTIDTYLPSFPDIGVQLHASHAEMQLTLSLYLFAAAFATLIYGPLSDGFGRRRVIMAALGIYTVASIGCALAATIDQLILLRIGQGLSASAGMVIGRAMVRDVFHGPEAQRVMARVMLLFSVAPAVAPILGGWLHDVFGWHSVFLFLAIVAALLLLMIRFGITETLALEHRHSIHPLAILRAYGMALRNGHFLRLVFCFAMMFSGFFVYVAGSPSLIYDILGLGATDFWVMFVPSVAAIMIGSQLAGWLAGRLAPEQTVRLGIAILLTGALLNVAQSLWLAPTVWSVVGPLGIYVLGMAISMPVLNLMALDCFPRNRGMASAVQSFVQMSFTAFVVGVVVPLAVQALPYMAGAMLVLSLIGLALWMGRGEGKVVSPQP